MEETFYQNEGVNQERGQVWNLEKGIQYKERGENNKGRPHDGHYGSGREAKTHREPWALKELQAPFVLQWIK